MTILTAFIYHESPMIHRHCVLFYFDPSQVYIIYKAIESSFLLFEMSCIKEGVGSREVEYRYNEETEDADPLIDNLRLRFPLQVASSNMESEVLAWSS